MQGTKPFLPNIIYAYVFNRFVHCEHTISDSITLQVSDLNELLLSHFFLCKFNARLYIIRILADMNTVVFPVLPKFDKLCVDLLHSYSLRGNVSNLDSIFEFYIVSYYMICSKSYFSTLLIIRSDHSEYFCGAPKLVNFNHFRKFKSMFVCVKNYYDSASRPDSHYSPQPPNLLFPGFI